ncbi:restriction endonuclease subunit S [Glaesserella parasuis]|uniref:restriction endonuclease subunit S n=1 Tax=Glaesserella parasuis TaxID=738 RepID=UPI002436489D|nr:restriction endonuclease subunit S [Glaesserella parasuis]MDG6290041.1 restriction endonuclease subunit S [Glaesserella parasuis]MDG6292181.1 restriction endonuclease subunit S [Glaesserella parasuis]
MIENRFIEKLLNGREVEWKPLGKIVETITAPSKVKREIYQEKGRIPIIDQGEKFISGYTDIDFGSLKSDEYIIFGDHSEHIKYVNFSFIQGADGLKILKPKNNGNAKYIYYAFQNFYNKELNYKRHWNTAKETLIPLPPPDVQQEIVRILDAFTSLTAELTAELTSRQKQYQYFRDKLLNFDDISDRGGGRD